MGSRMCSARAMTCRTSTLSGYLLTSNWLHRMLSPAISWVLMEINMATTRKSTRVKSDAMTASQTKMYSLNCREKSNFVQFMPKVVGKM